jgi:hypothetical protein
VSQVPAELWRPVPSLTSCIELQLRVRFHNFDVDGTRFKTRYDVL